MIEKCILKHQNVSKTTIKSVGIHVFQIKIKSKLHLFLQILSRGAVGSEKTILVDIDLLHPELHWLLTIRQFKASLDVDDIRMYQFVRDLNFARRTFWTAMVSDASTQQHIKQLYVIEHFHMSFLFILINLTNLKSKADSGGQKWHHPLFWNEYV